MAFGLSIAQLLEKLSETGKRFALRSPKLLARPLIALLPGDKGVQDVIIGLGAALTDRAIAKEKKRKPPTGIRRNLDQISLVTTAAQRVMGGSMFELMAQAVALIDMVTDMALSDTVSEVVDVPEEMIQDSIRGMKRIHDELLKQQTAVINVRLGRK